jgi:nitrite reductase (NADH) small subunit
MQWTDVCSVADLQENSGVCALVNSLQVAIFYLGSTNQGLNSSGNSTNLDLYAIGNFDPIGKANVLSRGVLGDINGQIVVASPLYKQHFNLETGVCLEDMAVSVPVYACRIENDRVQVDTRSIAILRQFIETSAATQQEEVTL